MIAVQWNYQQNLLSTAQGVARGEKKGNKKNPNKPKPNKKKANQNPTHQLQPDSKPKIITLGIQSTLKS